MPTHLKLTLHDLNDGHDIANITDELPEVYDLDYPDAAEVSMGNSADGEYSVCIREGSHTADWFYRAALCNLAMWQHKLGEPARLAAEEEAAKEERSKRVKELADLIEEVIVDDRAIRVELIATAILNFQADQEGK